MRCQALVWGFLEGMVRIGWLGAFTLISDCRADAYRAALGLIELPNL